ncbi:MAG: hypothetical protein ACR2LQ_10390 [Acidimicrobiales bacterium]
MRQRDRRRLRPLVVLGLVALVAAIGANGSARAQTVGGPSLADQFGGYKLAARGDGMLLAFDAVGFIPGNSRIVQVGLPEAQATGAGGPTNYALASLAYPGSVVGDLGAIVAQGGGGDAGAAVPSFPLQTCAYFPGPPTEADQQIIGATSVSTATETTSDGTAFYDGNDLPQFLRTGGITVHAGTHLEDGRAVSQLRSDMVNIDFAGILTIGSVVTDIRADTDGTTGASAGTTTVSGVKVLGLDATIDDTGVHFVPPSGAATSTPGPTTTAKPSVLGPLLDPITSQIPLDGLLDGLKPIAQGLTSLITTTVGATGSINDVLKQGGISIHLLGPTGNDSGAVANRIANGLVIELNYNPNTNAVLSSLVSLLPTQQLPSDQLIPGLPLNSSPQGLVGLLQQVYGVTISLVPGAVDAQANPPFLPSAFSAGGAAGGATSGSSATGATKGTGGFNTAAPGLGGGSGATSPSLGDASPVSFFGDAVPLWAAILLLLSMPFWGAGSSKLADNTLAATSSSCPEGLDVPDLPGGAP